MKPIEKWELAAPLADAWLAFAPDDMRAAFGGARDGMSVFADAIEASPNDGFLKAVSDGLSARAERNSLIEAMRERLLDDLFNSDLQAIGYRLLPSKSHRPVLVDPDLFEAPNVDWENSTIEWLGCAFTRVRIFNSQQFAAKQKPKAKGSIAAIDAAIIALKSSHRDFCNLPRQQSSQLVREQIGKGVVRGNGLSDQNISKHILRHCPKRAIKLK